VLSAFGTLVTPVRIDLARSMVRPLASIAPADRDALLDELRAEGIRVLSAAVFAPSRSTSATASMARYLGQGNEINALVRRGPGLAGHLMPRSSSTSRPTTDASTG